MTSVINVANCFLSLDEANDGDGLSNLKLQKLCYYAQGFHLAMFDEPLFSEDIEAWAHGPVVSDMYHTYKSNGKHPVPYPKYASCGNLTNQSKELIEEVYLSFGGYSAWMLRNMTHEEPTWMNHEADASLIPHDELNEYFKTRLN